MKMKNPPHPGEIVGDNLAELATGFINIQVAIEALDRAVEDENRILDRLPSGTGGR